jgi:gas vesicle protein
MSNKDKTKSFLSGLLLGITGGVLAGLFTAPKSGKELREDIAKRASDLSEEAKDFYVDTRQSLEKRVKALKKAGESVDKDKYVKLVKEVVDEFKSDSTVTKKTAEKIGKLLHEDFDTVVNSVKSAKA